MDQLIISIKTLAIQQYFIIFLLVLLNIALFVTIRVMYVILSEYKEHTNKLIMWSREIATNTVDMKDSEIERDNLGDI